ncbi:MAG: hypothetical protein HC796_00205 [Synechococcaceae cyanobacterium RL_1_2]|nr:hypothetical protein [Synechococcaceae cyanobacterium RL_1_2]
MEKNVGTKKFIAIVTGVISIAIAIAYMLLVAALDFRGEMIPAPVLELIFKLPNLPIGFG